MGVLERIKSAISGSIPVEDDLDMGDTQRVRNLPQSDDPNDAVPETEAQSKADTAESNAESYADTEIENHRSSETHAQAQPPQNHGNGSHNTNYLDSNDYNPESDTHSRYTDGEAADAAPVDSVNGQTGAVSVSSPSTASDTSVTKSGSFGVFNKADYSEWFPCGFFVEDITVTNNSGASGDFEAAGLVGVQNFTIQFNSTETFAINDYVYAMGIKGTGIEFDSITIRPVDTHGHNLS
jgi:hypothetical protein